jgi:hypothetical protein
MDCLVDGVGLMVRNSLMVLSDFFERIVVISLPQRDDRRSRLSEELLVSKLAEPLSIRWERAISGKICPPPNYFRAGPGAWGCLQSHIRVVQDAMMDGVSSLLVLEDDLAIHAKAPEIVRRFFQELPDDWDQIYLGGQHQVEPSLVDYRPMVHRVRNVNRTHAYGLSGRAFREFLRHVCDAPSYAERGSWHIDHQLGLAHESELWRCYSPAWWPFGQRAGVSNISGSSNPDLWWHPGIYSNQVPMLYAPNSSEQTLREVFGEALCWWTDSNSAQVEVPLDTRELFKRLEGLSKQALEGQRLPTVCHPMISNELLSRAWDAGALAIEDADVVRMQNFPFNRLFAHPLNGNQALPLDSFRKGDAVG